MSAKWVENERKNEKWVERTHFFQIEFERSALPFLKVRNESESTHQICERSIVCLNLYYFYYKIFSKSEEWKKGNFEKIL